MGMNLEDTVLSEISQTQKDKYCVISLTRGIYKVGHTETEWKNGYQGLSGGEIW